jgi:hypothetical protein
MAMKFLWDAYHDTMLLLLNFHHVWMTYAPVINVILYMLYSAYPFVYFDISNSTYQIEMKFLW